MKQRIQKIAGIIRDFHRELRIAVKHSAALELAARIEGFKDLHQSQQKSNRPAPMIARPQALDDISLSEAIRLLQDSSAVIIDDHVVVLANPDEESGRDGETFLSLEWDDEGRGFRVDFTEGANRRVKRVGSSLFLRDSSGEETQVTLLAPMELAPPAATLHEFTFGSETILCKVEADRKTVAEIAATYDGNEMQIYVDRAEHVIDMDKLTERWGDMDEVNHALRFIRANGLDAFLREFAKPGPGRAR